MSLFEFTLHTEKECFIKIAEQIEEALKKSGARQGVCVVFSPHTTTGITINENVDPSVALDIMSGYKRAFPDRPDYAHQGGNSFAHIRSSVMGCSETLIVKDGRLLLGKWQTVYFVEFDGPRERTFYVKILEG